MPSHPNRNRAAAKIAAAIGTARNHDHDYSALLLNVCASFEAAANPTHPLFLTDADGLNELYLDSLPNGERQLYNCHACRDFLRRYGGLAAVGDAGEIVPALWRADSVPEFYRPAFAALHARVKRARIVSPFFSTLRVWGSPVTGEWSHMAVVPPAELVYRERALTASQAMAAAKENFRAVATALSEFTAPMLDEAIRVLAADALARSDKFIGPVKWLRALHDRPKGRFGENLLWRSVAEAPEGYCHPRASVIAPLLADIAAGLSFDEIKRRFHAMLHPLRYQRPQAAPAAGNIKAAEALVAKLGIAPSLERRFCRLDETPALWRPAPNTEQPTQRGVFGHIKPKNDVRTIPPVELPPVAMTWEKFTRAILPSAERIEIHIPERGPFIALTTAVHADAPPILKWDQEDERNPVAWYCYHNGSPAMQWGLIPGWNPVTAIIPLPTLWGNHPAPHLGDGMILALSGALDSNRHSGNALFPEFLKGELHGARATIEAYSRTTQLGEPEGAAACGYDLRKGPRIDCLIRMLAAGAWTSYHIDRWD